MYIEKDECICSMANAYRNAPLLTIFCVIHKVWQPSLWSCTMSCDWWMLVFRPSSFWRSFSWSVIKKKSHIVSQLDSVNILVCIGNDLPVWWMWYEFLSSLSKATPESGSENVIQESWWRREYLQGTCKEMLISIMVVRVVRELLKCQAAKNMLALVPIAPRASFYFHCKVLFTPPLYFLLRIVRHSIH